MVYYGGKPIEQVDFEKEFNKELEELTERIHKLKTQKYGNKKLFYQYWTLKLHQANEALKVGEVTLS